MSSRGFYLQYVALLMILVAFMVGSYARRHELPVTVQGDSTAEATPEVPELQEFDEADTPPWSTPAGSELQLVSQLTLKELFARGIRGEERLREEELYGLVAMLRAHDLRADLHVFAPTAAELLGDRPASLEDDFDRALRRGQQLAAALIAQGLPPEAFSILVAPTRNPQQIRVAFSSVGAIDG